MSETSPTGYEAVKEAFVVMVNDRHTDPYPVLFFDAESAISFARTLALDWLIEESPGRWLFSAKHESEEDCVWVVRVEPGQEPR